MADAKKRNNRQIARDQFSGKWVLDLLGDIVNPGKDDRRAEREAQQSATDLWLSQLGSLPGADYYYTPEAEIWGPGSGLTDSALRGNQEYQQGTQAQLAALRQMQGIAGAGGYTGLERDQIAQAQRQAAAAEKSQRDAQVQQMEMRGMAGGGGEMAARLAAQQGGANRAQGAATDIATQAQMRALQAMQAGGQMGQQVQSNATNRAQAIDAFNQANTNRAQAVRQRNAAALTGARVQETQDRMGVLAGATGQYNMNAASAAQNARDRQAQTSSILNTAVGVVA